MARRFKHKISKKEAAFAYRMITQENLLYKDVARMLGRERTLLRAAIRREIDPEFRARRGLRSTKSRVLTPEQYAYAKKFYAGSGLPHKRSAKILAKKYGWSWHLMFYMLMETSDYESAMKYAKNFNFTELFNREHFKWRKRFGEA